MPIRKGGGGGGGGGGSLNPGPATNTFTGASKSAAATARDTYATANPTWLAEYDAETSFVIILTYGTSTTYQARRSSAWADVTPILRGPAGGKGDKGDTGGATSAWQEHWTGDINWTSVRVFAAAGTAIPDDASEIAVRFGAYTSGGEAESGQWFIYPIADFEAIVASAVGTAASNGDNVRALVDWGKDTLSGGFARRDMLIGRTSANILLVATENTGEDAYGMEIFYRTDAPVTVASVGDATGGLPQATEALEGDVRIDRNTLIEYACVKRFHATTAPTGTWADIPDRADLFITHAIGSLTPALNSFAYDPIRKQFYAGTLVGVGRVAWVQDVADDALAGSLVTNTNDVHWLGKHANDDIAIGLLSSLATATEYFYYNTHLGTIRRLDNTSFTAAGSVISHYVWRPTRGGPDVDNAGFVVDVTEEHSPPTPSPDNAKNIYIDRSISPPRIWVPHERAAPATRPSATTTDVATGTYYLGVHYVNPSTAASGRWYYNRNTHAWRYYRAGHYYAVTWSEIKAQATSDGTALFFNTDDVFLSEVQNSGQAAQIIENAGNYSADTDYYWVQGSVLKKLNVFTAAITNLVIHDYRAFDTGYRAPPTAIWYLHGQTEKWPASYPYTQDAASNRLRMRWSGDDPDEIRYGWDTEVDSIWPASISGNIDGSANPAASTANVVFSLPLGSYDIDATLGTEDETIGDDEFGTFLYQITSGDDTILPAPSSARNSNFPGNFGSVAGTVIRMEATDLDLDGTEQLYILAFVATAADDWRGFMRIRKNA